MASEGGGFRRYSFHEVAISADRVGVEVENFKTGAIEIFRQPFAGNGHRTLFPAPCPSGPVVVSTPEVMCDSGCPGVLLSICRKRLISSKDTAGSFVTFPCVLTARTPVKWSVA